MNLPKETKEGHNEAKTSDAEEDMKRWEGFLTAARKMMSDSDYGKSLSYFAYVIHHAPRLSNEVHDDFLFALKSWCQVLENHGKIEDLVRCLNEARKLFPDSAHVFNHVGSALFRLNLFDEAAVYFRRAMTLDPGLHSAQENLDSVANLLVERWHFRMLNDRIRNEAYKAAIGRAVKRGCDHVLDIGSGTGILSMFAVQSGAKQVFACEMSKTMFDLSLDIVKANQMQDFIHMINKKSCDLKVPDDIPTRVSLIVTETLDCGLLGEGIIETLAHARSELLVADCSKADTRNFGNSSDHAEVTSQVIPQGATIYGRIIQSEKIREYSRVHSKILDLDLSGVNIKGAEFSEKAEEPYTTEEMSCIEHTCLSKPLHVISYDFRTPEKYIPESNVEIKVPIVNSGSVDAVITWFELKLDDSETISSAPGQSICWEQAVYPNSGFAGNENAVEPGDEVVLHARLTSRAIFIKVDHIIKAHETVWNKDVELGKSYVLPFPEVSKLNDVGFNENFQQAISDAFSEVRTICNVNKNPEATSYGCLVLSDSPNFNPLFAATSGFSPVLCISQESSFANCLEAIRAGNRLPDSVQFTEQNLESLGKCERWEVLVADPIEPSGVLRRGVIEDVVFAKGCILSKSTGIVLPRKIEVWGMLISSKNLCRKSRMTGNDVTVDLDIARFMNTFQVKNQIDIDVNSNPYVRLTQPAQLLTFDFSAPSDSDDESPLALLQLSREVRVTADKAGPVDGLMYWFVVDFAKQRKLSTGPDSSSHFNQVVIVFKDKLKLSVGDELLVTTSCKNSCIAASVKHS